MKKQLLLFLFAIVTIAGYSQDFTWHEVQNCTQLNVITIESVYTPSVPNPNTTGINTNANVSKLVQTGNNANPADGRTRLALPKPIMETTGQSISFELLSPETGGNGIGSGFFQVYLQSLNPVTTTLIQNVTVTTANTWQLVTLSLDGKANATNGYEYIYIVAGGTVFTDPEFYFDKIKGSVTQGIVDFSPDLVAGNAWYDYKAGGVLNATRTPDLGVSDAGRGVLLTEVATPSTDGLDSPTVLKVVRESGIQSFLLYEFGAKLAATGTLKFRVYAECANTANVMQVLLRDSDQAPVTTGQLSISVTPKANAWKEIEIDISSMTGTALTGEMYDELHIRFDWNNILAAGNTYYVEALQGPSSATLSLVDVKVSDSSFIELYPNPAKNTFVLSQEVDSATIYDIMGRTIKEINTKQTKFDVSTLTKGVYFIEVSINNTKETIRFIKN